MTQEFNLFGSPGAMSNPFPYFATLRANAPVIKLGGFGLWAISRYDDVLRVLRDPETFSSVVGVRQMAGDEVPPSMIFNDPPVHTRLRGLISKAFTPRTVELQRDAIQEYCDRLIDKMLAKDESDIVADLAYPLPVMVIANMLGVADGDLATFKRWSDAIIQNVGTSLLVGDDSALTEVNEEFDRYFKRRLDKLREEPEDNLLSGLVHAETEEGRLSEVDLLVICRLLLVAGNETTTGLIINSMRVFSEFPDAMTRVRKDMALLPSAIEETLRYYPPFAATFRRTTRDVEIEGVTIPANERLIALLASANRDDSAFPQADNFIVDREPNRHLSFGMGIHYCIGAPLARLEGDIALRTLLPRIKSVRISGDVDGDSLLRPGGPESMMVRFERDAAPVGA